MQGVNEKDVEKVKTGQGMTKFLIQNAKGEGANIMIRYWGPETDLAIHSHPYDEMWYVLEGEVEFGDTTYGVGSCIYIPKNVPYGPTRAPKGAALLRYAEDVGA
jgi:mannose-6-phosphate isomerase-like protein (cupin superfamily)